MKNTKTNTLTKLEDYQALQKTWRLLKGLHPQHLDLSKIELIVQSDIDTLKDNDSLIDIILNLGLNDEGLDEFPKHLHQYCGQGLRIWQYPNQFAPYLAFLTQLNISSYLELGIRHGGSYITTVEILNRFKTLDYSIAVDIIPCSAMIDYQMINPNSRFICMNSQSTEFLNIIKDLSSIDLVFIDSHHEEQQGWNEFLMLSQYANMIALHDITNDGCLGIAKVWQKIKRLPDWTCFEFTEQYLEQGSFMGIGLAIKNHRLTLIK